MENDEYEINEKTVADQATEKQSPERGDEESGEFRFDDWALI